MRFYEPNKGPSSNACPARLPRPAISQERLSNEVDKARLPEVRVAHWHLPALPVGFLRSSGCKQHGLCALAQASNQFKVLTFGLVVLGW